MKSIKIQSILRYNKNSEREKIDIVLEKLKSEGWKIDQPELHKEGLNLHVIYLKRTINV